MRRRRVCLLAALAVTVPTTRADAIGVGKAAAESGLCVDAIDRAAWVSGVSVALLRALAPTESGLPRAHGRGLSYPWPWTHKTNGSGSFKPTCGRKAFKGPCRCRDRQYRYRLHASELALAPRRLRVAGGSAQPRSQCGLRRRIAESCARAAT